MAKCELTAARWEDIPRYMQILGEGRAFQRAQGFVQWPDGYPRQVSVEEDVRNGNGYAIMVDGRLAGYFHLGFDGDPAYPAIVGAWRFHGPYAVVHRIAISDAFRGQGLTGEVFHLIEELCKARGVDVLRIDTHEKNLRMRHVVQKNGFAFCGKVLQNDGLRLAFDKKI